MAAEAKCIRRECDRLRSAVSEKGRAVRREMIDHRRGIVRTEARASLLAYGYLRGRRYLAIEAKCHDSRWGIYPRVCKIVEGFGGDKAGVHAWMERQMITPVRRTG